MRKEFKNWYKANETRFAHSQFSDKDIIYSAWLEGRKTIYISEQRELLIAYGEWIYELAGCSDTEKATSLADIYLANTKK